MVEIPKDFNPSDHLHKSSSQYDERSMLIEEINIRLRDNVVELVTHLSGDAPNTRWSNRNEVRFGRKGGIAVCTSGSTKGRITMFDGDGMGRSPFQYIQSELNCSFNDAVDWAANWLGLSPDYKPDPEVARLRFEKRQQDQRQAEILEQADKERRIAKAVAIFDAAEVIE
jgi:hypothetical protein